MRRRRQNPEHQALLKANRHRYEEMLEAQDGHCALCPRTPSPRRRLDMDHDHKRMVIRGLLCHRCNRVLKEWMSSAWLKAASDYVDRTV